MRWQLAQFFEFRWWKNYLRGKSPNEYLEWKREYWMDFLQSLDLKLDHISYPAIDIGCGPAGMFMILPGETTAVDPLLTSYQELPIFNQSSYAKVNFVHSSFEDFVSEKQFNTILCLNAINHFIDIEASFGKLAELSTEQGQLIISVDAHNHGFFRKLFSWVPLDVLHPHQYTLPEYEAFIEAAGFRIEKKVLSQQRFFFDYWIIKAKRISA